MTHTPVLQFGTSRFLQAHADLFLAEAGGGPVSVVQTSGSGARAHRLAALVQGYDVRIRGLDGGRVIDERRRVDVIARGLSVGQDRAEVERIIAQEAGFILSNTADAGYRPQPQDSAPQFDPAMSFPAKLAHLLRARFEAGGDAPQIMPTELVQDNGQVLRGLVLDAAGAMEPRYRDWLAKEVIWVNSLVDRIVSEPIEPAGAVAEPYALWAIEQQPGLRSLCHHPAIAIVPDLGVIERRKLFVLNLGHTLMAADWLARGGAGAGLVREVMEDRARASALADLYQDEVRPAFVAANEADGIDDYIRVTCERFSNPCLDHRLEDIAQNHREKLQRRIAAFVEWARAHGDNGAKPRLMAALDAAV